MKKLALVVLGTIALSSSALAEHIHYNNDHPRPDRSYRYQFGEPWYMNHNAYGPSVQGPTVDYQPSARIIHVPPDMQWNDTIPEPSRSLSYGEDANWPTQEEFRAKALADELSCDPVRVYGDRAIVHPALGCRK